MRTKVITVLTTIGLMGAVPRAHAVCDDASPSLTVAAGTTKTITLPEDGRLDCTTVQIDGTLTFGRNARNTPAFIVATGDIAVTSTGRIGLPGSNGTSSPPQGGAGGPGGFAGGDPGFGTLAPGDGNGPGGGTAGQPSDPRNDNSAGSAAYGPVVSASVSALDGVPYGSPLLVPLVGGSGGGGVAGSGSANVGCGGGGGGGAVLLISQTRIVMDGGVDAYGGYPSCDSNVGTGSGGAIRLVAPKVEGGGYLDVQSNPQYGPFISPSYFGAGRIRIDTIDRSDLRLEYRPPGAATVGAFMSAFGEGNLPALNIIQAAGTAIAETSGPVSITLPFGQPEDQSVTVKATNFTGTVPIEVVLVPSSGDRVKYPATITMNGQATAQAVVNVKIKPNDPTRIWAWTK